MMLEEALSASSQIGTAVYDTYLSLCDEHSMPPETSIETSFRSCLSILPVPTERQLSVVLLVLTRCPPSAVNHLKRLVVTAEKLSWKAIDSLLVYLESQTHFTHLSLNRVHLGDSAVAKLLHTLGMADASPVTHLSLSATGISTKGAVQMSTLLTTPLGALAHLDLSNNAANHRGVQAIEKAVSSRHTPLLVNLSGNLVTVEVLNTVTHAVGAGAALLGGIMLTYRAYANNTSTAVTCSLAVFALSLFTLLTSSAVYHAAFRAPRWATRLQKMDHCSIFLLIAGSYTPFMVKYAMDSSEGRYTLAAVWVSALVGIVRSVMGTGGSKARSGLALFTGWLGLLSWRVMSERMGNDLALVVGGGVAYSVGIVFYLLGKRMPSMHVVWHFAVMLGGGLHFVALWTYVAASNLVTG